jgi:hypothetical protein
MSNAPKPPRQSHSKQRRKVGSHPLPTTTTHVMPAENIAAQSLVEPNIVTQLTQECPDDDATAASTLLALSSSPIRPSGALPATLFNAMVDSIVGQGSIEDKASAPASSLVIDDSVTKLYSLGLHNKRMFLAVANMPSHMFGAQVSRAAKCQCLEQQQPLDPLRRLSFADMDGSEFKSSGTGGVDMPRATNVVAGTANFQRFNDNNCITSKNPDCAVVALRKLAMSGLPNNRFPIHLSVIRRAKYLLASKY